MGDGVLAYFGYPKAHEDDAERAAQAGLAIAEAAPLQNPHRETLHVRVGIATGIVVVGDLVGSGESSERGVVGDTPNLAARAVMITAGVEAVPRDQRRMLLEKVRAFDAFTNDNDPHGEHEFGSINEGGVRCFWKIDYYDRATEMGSPDPADPAVTTRVLTVMLADEY